MSVVSWIMAIFSLIGAVDYLIGNKFGVGGEFEKGIKFLGTLVLSMVGMLVMCPLIAKLVQPLMNAMTGALDPSVIPAMLFANDMGGASLSTAVANEELIGKFHALVVSSMMGCTLSFTIPYVVGVVPKAKHESMFLGLLCGVVTIPFGCIVGGIMLGVPFGVLIINSLPLMVLAGVIALGLLKFPRGCIKVFSGLGVAIKFLVTVGLAVGIFEFLTGVKLIPYTDNINLGMEIVINASCVMTGAFPLIKIISTLLKKPITALGGKMGINATSAIGFLSSLATTITTFGIMSDMDDKGTIYNSAFAVSGGFTFAGHLAFTLAMDASCLPAVIVGKLVSAFLGLGLACLLFGKTKKTKTQTVQPIA